MSLILTLTGRSNVLTASYFPPLDLSDDDYELGLTNFETYNTIPNVNSSNNKFYFDDNDETITIPIGSYELRDISAYLRAAILRKRRRQRRPQGAAREPGGRDGVDGASDDKDDRDEDDDDGEYLYDIEDEENENGGGEGGGDESGGSVLTLRGNDNTMRSEIKCAYRINFAKPNNIGSLLGFSPSRVLRPNKWYASDEPVSIIAVNTIRVECNLTTGAYVNGRSAHAIHEFAPNVPPGYKVSEIPKQIIYLPVIARLVTDVSLRVVDQDGRLIDFRGEEISIRLHVRRRR